MLRCLCSVLAALFFLIPCSGSKLIADSLDDHPSIASLGVPFSLQSGSLSLENTYCLEDHNGLSLLVEVSSGDSAAFDLDRWRSQVKRRIRTFRNERAELRGEGRRNHQRKIRQLTKRIRHAKRYIVRLRECSRGNLTVPPDYFNPEVDPQDQVSSEENPDFLSECEALAPSGELSTRIINGTVCPSTRSYLVHLTMNRRHFYLNTGCTGTLIGPGKILTAAHCLAPFRGREVTSVEIDVGTDVYETTAFAIHPLYNGISSEHDVGIVYFRDRKERPFMPILTTSNLEIGEQALIAGYGIDEYGRRGYLKVGRVTIDSFDSQLIFSHFLGEESNSCNGDSGGPLLVKRDGRWFVAGVVSAGTNVDCGLTDYSSYANLLHVSNLDFLN